MSEAERKSALKHERSQNVLLSSPLQAPGLKAAKVEEGGENGNVDVPMGGGVASLPQVPSFPKVAASSVPINVEGVAGESSSPEGGGLGFPVESFPGGGGKGDESGDEDCSMKALMKMMKKMDGKFDSIQVQFSNFRAELQNLKAEMVTNFFSLR